MISQFRPRWIEMLTILRLLTFCHDPGNFLRMNKVTPTARQKTIRNLFWLLFSIFFSWKWWKERKQCTFFWRFSNFNPVVAWPVLSQISLDLIWTGTTANTRGDLQTPQVLDFALKIPQQVKIIPITMC